MAAPVTAAPSVVEHIRVATPERSLAHDVRAVSIVWRRELIRFRTDRLRAVTSLVQPVLFLFMLGTGLGALAGHGMPPGVDFKTFIYPGVLAMSVLFTAIFSAGSIVWDREFGFPREILVAPVSRASIVIGKCLGGATIATFQGVVFLVLAGLAHVPYNPVLLLTLIGELLLLSSTLTAFGVMMAARIRQFQSFRALTQMLVMPLFFLPGALYPLGGLPAWLSVLTPPGPADVCRWSHAARCFLTSQLSFRVRPGSSARHYPGRLAGTAVAVVDNSRANGPGIDERGDCRVSQVRIIPRRRDRQYRGATRRRDRPIPAAYPPRRTRSAEATAVYTPWPG
jgi:ABC-2 type transport system permease protein